MAFYCISYGFAHKFYIYNKEWKGRLSAFLAGSLFYYMQKGAAGSIRIFICLTVYGEAQRSENKKVKSRRKKGGVGR